jgi:hypothetical protein
MEELRVPKRRVPVEFTLPGGATRLVTVFLAEFAHEHNGAERVLDLLSGEKQFIPAIDQQTDSPVFLNYRGIVTARVAKAIDADESEMHTIPTEHEVEVSLADGRVVSGLASYIRPPDRSRLADYLNEPSPFLQLIDKDDFVLVNKQFIAHVKVISP